MPHIELLTPSNTTLLSSVADDVFDARIDPARLAAYVAEQNHLMLVALADDVVVAQVAAVIHRHPDQPTELYIDNFGVAPAWHRQGLARKMLEEMFALGKARGCEEAWVGTEPDNLPARGLYESRGAAPEPFVMYEYQL